MAQLFFGRENDGMKPVIIASLMTSCLSNSIFSSYPFVDYTKIMFLFEFLNFLENYFDNDYVSYVVCFYILLNILDLYMKFVLFSLKF